jgi:hypothetical protein
MATKHSGSSLSATKLVTKTPKSWAGTFVELALGFVSRSVVIGPHWYVFKRGRGLLKLPATSATGEFRTGAPSSPDVLEPLVGSKWTLTNNCMTVFSPIWRPRMANAEDRLAIARSVTVSVVMIALAVIGMASAVSNFIIRPQTEQLLEQIVDLRAEVATLRRSNAAHFGQLKSLLKE